MDAMEVENLELTSKVSHVEHASNNLTNTSNQVTTASSPLDMAARHQVWSLSSIQDASLAQVGDIVVLKNIIRPTKTVAIRVLKSTDPSKEIEGEELGPNYWEVHVQVLVKPNESLIRSYGLIKTIGQAIGAHVACPAPFVGGRWGHGPPMDLENSLLFTFKEMALQLRPLLSEKQLLVSIAEGVKLTGL
ncbi:hypothetical protein TEA_003355 [Camellia sinensis var. sinensis]|uniref:Transposase Tnp1/En/Spm-like domain-containing protein n=1 Tax=Camellia sinensis var. sinensis TaxID=542762 RepID=A0A4S4DC48_CAMSN|nr:hypothetical protein TEA_003355 [Camellia sinensis var. sinensis]